MKEIVIKISDYFDNKYTALVGRPNGEKLLDLLKKKSILLRDLEKEKDIIYIDIPSYILTMNKSFFLGFLETRVQELGKEHFLKKHFRLV